jgi:hypothetical protein
MMAPLAVIFIAQQVSFFTAEHEASEHLQRTVDHVKFGAWLLLSAVLLAALYTGGFWLKSKAVRRLMDDEVTRVHRASALSLGFLVAMVAGIALYAVDLVTPMTAREAVHIVVTLGIATALVRFGMLERKVHSLG